VPTGRQAPIFRRQPAEKLTARASLLPHSTLQIQALQASPGLASGLPFYPSEPSQAMLKITIHDTPEALQLQLEGKLSGPWVAELESCWRTVASTMSGRRLAVDLRDVTFVDNAGRYLLALLHHSGAELEAGDPMMQALVREITQPSGAPR
jgi:hypothetical protein